MKKITAVLLCLCMLFSCAAITGYADYSAAQAKEILTACFNEEYSESVTDVSIGEAIPMYDDSDNIDAYALYISFKWKDDSESSGSVLNYWYRTVKGATLILETANGTIDTSLSWIKPDYFDDDVEKIYYCAENGQIWTVRSNGTITDTSGSVCTKDEMKTVFERARKAAAEREEREKLEERVESTESVTDFFKYSKDLSIEQLCEYLLELLKKICAYVLDYVYFPNDWNKTSADLEVEEALLEYCEENNCEVSEIYRVDKDYFVPNRQTYFSDGAPVGSGVCGVASWEMILGGYRDKGIFPDLPDDKTMYREIMAVMDDITAELQPKISALIKKYEPFIDSYINPLLSETGVTIDSDFDYNAYEILGTLDVGIAMYLNQYGYTEYARRVLSNITISLPILTPAKRALFMRDIKNELSGWIYRKTSGKLNLPTGCGSSTQDTVLRSLERGEPAVIGCWLSLLGDDDLTDHYFVATSLFKVKAEIKISDKTTVTVERNLIEIYDTWSDDSVELVDFDALANSTVSCANSLSLLF